MASELLEYEDDDDVNEESNIGQKRATPPTSVSNLEKKELNFVSSKMNSSSQKNVPP